MRGYIANYGSNLIVRCFVSSKKELPDLVILGSLLKQFVAMVDGAEILVSNGAKYAAELQLRTMFELSIYIEWILKEDTERRARLYFVWNLRRERYWTNAVIAGTPEHTQLASHLADLPNVQAMIASPESLKDAQHKMASINKQLAFPEFAVLNAEFDKLKGGKKYDPNWYSPFSNVTKISQLALKLGRNREYDIYYSGASGIAHGTKMFEQITFTDDEMLLENVRTLAGVQTTFRAIGIFCIGTYQNILRHYRYAELENFRRKYMEEWRERYMNIRDVVVKGDIKIQIYLQTIQELHKVEVQTGLH